jgi:hypothetical protein
MNLLSDSDAGCGDFVDENRALLQAVLPEPQWSEFEKLIQGYALGEARALLGAALEELKKE